MKHGFACSRLGFGLKGWCVVSQCDVTSHSSEAIFDTKVPSIGFESIKEGFI
jgi:hypothetical protein